MAKEQLNNLALVLKKLASISTYLLGELVDIIQSLAASNISDTANSNTDLASVMGDTGNYTQDEINEALAEKANINLDVWSAALVLINSVITAIQLTLSTYASVTDLENIDDIFSAAINDLEALVTDTENTKQYLGLINLTTVNEGGLNVNRLNFPYIPKFEGSDLFITGSSAPSIAPNFIGQEYIDQTNKKVYKAVTVTGSTNDWVLLN